MRNHWHIQIIQSFLCFQLKIFRNIMQLCLFQNLLLLIYIFQHLNCYINFFCFSVKFMKYFFSAVKAVSSKPFIRPFPRIKKRYRSFYYQYAWVSSYLHQTFACIKSNTISRIKIFIRINNFSQLDSTKKWIFIHKFSTLYIRWQILSRRHHKY